MDIAVFGKKAAQHLRRNGPLATARHALDMFRGNPLDRAFDREYGTDTGGIAPLWKLNVIGGNSQHGVRYQAAHTGTIIRAIDELPIDPANFTFIDLGAGKGRPLILAARRGFREVIGVEFAEELATSARANLAKLGIGNGVVHRMDALHYVFPAGDLVVFLYNPFGPVILEPVVANISRAPGNNVYILYVNPCHDEVLARAGTFERLHDAPGLGFQIWRRTSIPPPA